MGPVDILIYGATAAAAAAVIGIIIITAILDWIRR